MEKYVKSTDLVTVSTCSVTCDGCDRCLTWTLGPEASKVPMLVEVIQAGWRRGYTCNGMAVFCPECAAVAQKRRVQFQRGGHVAR